MVTTETLQKKIEKRASERLQKDINELLQSIGYNSKFHKLIAPIDINANLGTVENPKMLKLYEILHNNSIKEKIYNSNIERYIKDETDMFLAEIEALKQKVKENTEQIENLWYKD